MKVNLLEEIDRTAKMMINIVEIYSLDCFMKLSIFDVKLCYYCKVFLTFETTMEKLPCRWDSKQNDDHR